MMHDPQDTVDVVVLGAGSAAEALAGALAPLRPKIVVIERSRVGGECPFLACIPSKSMLHDGAACLTWDEAVQHRDEIVRGLDDTGHAQNLEDDGAELVRGTGRLLDEHTVRVGDRTIRAEHVVLATGAEAVIPNVRGLDELGDLRWTSADALTAVARPRRLVILGGGVIGMELAQLFASFDTDVEMLDQLATGFPDLSPEVGHLVDDALRGMGVAVRRSTEVVSIRRESDEVVVELASGASLNADRLLVAAGRRARTHGIGLESLGIDPHKPLPVDDRGRVACQGSVWAIGDVAGRGQYTHLANHQAKVVANQLAGDGTRRFDDAVLPACVFTAPPVMVVGPTRDQLRDDPDVVWTTHRLDEIARSATDRPSDGVLAVAARRSTGTVIAAHGTGPRFDELAIALVVAIDGKVPVHVLARSMSPFPTMSDLLSVAFQRLDADLHTIASDSALAGS